MAVGRDDAWRLVAFVLVLVGSIIFAVASDEGKTGMWQVCSRRRQLPPAAPAAARPSRLSPSTFVHACQVFYWYSAMLILTSAITSHPSSFFTGKSVGKTVADQVRKAVFKDAPKEGEGAADRSKVGFWTLMPSAFITWIFAKSINNAAVLGGYYGVLGGFAYAAWYTSFWTAGIVGYVLRTRHGYRSLTLAVDTLYGPTAGICLGLALLYRLFNEVWSNTAVVAGFYGSGPSDDSDGDSQWWWAVVLSTLVPLTYVMMGGMRSSLFSDVVQAAMAIVFLFIILGVIGQKMDGLSNLWSYEPPLGANVTYQPSPGGGWLVGGETLLGAGLVQGVFSYPFMDPVLMDRAFLSTPRTMLYSFGWGGLIAGTFIVLFSAIGIYGCVLEDAVKKGAPTVVAASLGGASEVLIMLVMMTSSLSTLDSTFTATGKLFGLEFGGWFLLPGDKRATRGPLKPTDEANVSTSHVAVARLCMVVLGIVSTFYLLADSTVLNATTVSGTMVMGLGPPIYLALFWRYASTDASDDGWRQSPLAFLFSFAMGVVWGSLFQDEKMSNRTHPILADMALGDGSYAKLFGVNVWGHLSCAGACAVGFAIDQWVLPLLGVAALTHPRTRRQPDVEHHLTGESVPRGGGGGARVAKGTTVDVSMTSA